VHFSITSANDQLDAQLLYFIIRLLQSSNVLSNFVLIIRRSNSFITSSGMVTLCNWPSGAQVERELLCTDYTGTDIERTPDMHILIGSCSSKLKYRSLSCHRLRKDIFALKVPGFVSFRFSLKNCSESKSKSGGY